MNLKRKDKHNIFNFSSQLKAGLAHSSHHWHDVYQMLITITIYLPVIGSSVSHHQQETTSLPLIMTSYRIMCRHSVS